MGYEEEWKTLHVQNEMAKVYQLTAVSFEDKVILFGGQHDASYNMYSLDEDGTMLEDLSADPLIPGAMC